MKQHQANQATMITTNRETINNNQTIQAHIKKQAKSIAETKT